MYTCVHVLYTYSIFVYYYTLLFVAICIVLFVAHYDNTSITHWLPGVHNMYYYTDYTPINHTD
jgi:hypothetical protein